MSSELVKYLEDKDIEFKIKIGFIMQVFMKEKSMKVY